MTGHVTSWTDRAGYAVEEWVDIDPTNKVDCKRDAVHYGVLANDTLAEYGESTEEQIRNFIRARIGYTINKLHYSYHHDADYYPNYLIEFSFHCWGKVKKIASRTDGFML